MKLFKKKHECKRCKELEEAIAHLRLVNETDKRRRDKYDRWLSEEYKKKINALQTELDMLREATTELIKDPIEFQSTKRRSEKELTLECVILTLKDMQKELLHFDSLAISHEEYRKLHGEQQARMWADVGYDALTYAIEKLQI